jgi:arginine exporter protein ArgO
MFQQVGRFLLEAREKRRTRIAAIVIIFIVFGSVDFFVAWMVDATRLPLAAHGTVDGIIVGGGAAFTAWFALEAADRERQRITKGLEQEAQLNHDIRNALEVITQAGYLISDLDLKGVVRDSVTKIDSILKERKPPKA